MAPRWLLNALPGTLQGPRELPLGSLNPGSPAPDFRFHRFLTLQSVKVDRKKKLTRIYFWRIYFLVLKQII